jgi:lipopolysaccharide assembly outer membrane protein LptD (OstA)
MKLPLVARPALWIACLAIPVVAQTALELPKVRIQQALHNPEAIVVALSATDEGEIYHLKGAVELRTDTLLLRADEADYNHETGEINAHGDVKVTPASPLITSGLSQFGVK